MARTFSGDRGKSGSRKFKPSKIAKAVPIDKEEVEGLVLKLWDATKNPSLVGNILRDSYGIGSVKEICGKGIMEIVAEKRKVPYPFDLLQLMKRAVNLREHLKIHKSDKHNTLRLQQIESKIRRLGKYYIKKKILPSNWTYDPEQAKLIVK
jgi:small subunit ribosomal protein S15